MSPLQLLIGFATVLNPYTPSEARTSLSGNRRILPASTVFGLCIGALLLLGVLALAVYIPYLCLQYPGLTDPPARPLHYWPEIGVLVASIAVGIGLLIGLLVFLMSFATWRRLRIQLTKDATLENNQGCGESSAATDAGS